MALGISQHLPCSEAGKSLRIREDRANRYGDGMMQDIIHCSDGDVMHFSNEETLVFTADSGACENAVSAKIAPLCPMRPSACSQRGFVCAAADSTTMANRGEAGHLPNMRRTQLHDEDAGRRRPTTSHRHRVVVTSEGGYDHQGGGGGAGHGLLPGP